MMTMKRLILIASVLAATLSANSRLALSSPVADWPLVVHGVSAELHRDSVDRWSATTAECSVAPSNVTAIDSYGSLRFRTDIPGQAHHLNQNAAYGSQIPTAEGVSSKLQGNAFFDVGSPHYTVHEGLESFWDQFRRGGLAEDFVPTNSQYNRALYNSLQEAGLSPNNALDAVRAAKQQQLEFGLRGFHEVPTIPGPLRQVPRRQ